jgi:hypothetical protein
MQILLNSLMFTNRDNINLKMFISFKNSLELILKIVWLVCGKLYANFLFALNFY